MGFWTLLLITSLGTFIGGYLLSSSFKAFCKRAWARITKRPLIKPKLMAELRVLEDIVPKLLKINSIPSYPDKLKASDIRDLLIDVGDKARELEYKDFAELRGWLIAFSDHAPSLNVNMNPLAVLKLLGRETAYKLVEDIRAKVSETIKGKEKKKKRAV